MRHKGGVKQNEQLCMSHYLPDCQHSATHFLHINIYFDFIFKTPNLYPWDKFLDMFKKLFRMASTTFASHRTELCETLYAGPTLNCIEIF